MKRGTFCWKSEWGIVRALPPDFPHSQVTQWLSFPSKKEGYRFIEENEPERLWSEKYTAKGRSQGVGRKMGNMWKLNIELRSPLSNFLPSHSDVWFVPPSQEVEKFPRENHWFKIKDLQIMIFRKFSNKTVKIPFHHSVRKPKIICKEDTLIPKLLTGFFSVS